MKSHKAKCQVYGIDFLFVTHTDRERAGAEKKLDRFFGDKGNKIESDEFASCFSMEGASKIAIVIQRETRDQMIAWMVHESLHAAQHVYRWRNIHWSTKPGEHETQCYYLQWVMSECLKVL